MKILVLGGTGAMGTELVKLAVGANNDVYVTSRSNHNSQLNNIYYIRGDHCQMAF